MNDSKATCTCPEPYGDFICPAHNVNVHTGEPTPSTPTDNIDKQLDTILTGYATVLINMRLKGLNDEPVHSDAPIHQLKRKRNRL